MIRVAIADDHPLVREGLRRILREQRDIELVGEAANKHETVELVRKRRPDVILLDICMAETELDGIEATREIVSLGGRTKVLILTYRDDEQLALLAMRAGALGYVLKAAKLDELLNAIRTVHEGRSYLPAKFEKSFAESFVRPQAKRKFVENLSPRELQVVCWLAKGSTIREIAQKLHIDVKTVYTHRRNVLKKLKLRNNSEITRFAIQQGLVEVMSP